MAVEVTGETVATPTRAPVKFGTPKTAVKSDARAELIVSVSPEPILKSATPSVGVPLSAITFPVSTKVFKLITKSSIDAEFAPSVNESPPE